MTDRERLRQVQIQRVNDMYREADYLMQHAQALYAQARAISRAWGICWCPPEFEAIDCPEHGNRPAYVTNRTD